MFTAITAILLLVQQVLLSMDLMLVSTVLAMELVLAILHKKLSNCINSRKKC